MKNGIVLIGLGLLFAFVWGAFDNTVRSFCMGGLIGGFAGLLVIGVLRSKG